MCEGGYGGVSMRESGGRFIYRYIEYYFSIQDNKDNRIEIILVLCSNRKREGEREREKTNKRKRWEGQGRKQENNLSEN